MTINDDRFYKPGAIIIPMIMIVQNGLQIRKKYPIPPKQD